MDSNNFVGNVGAGEREARVYSSLVYKRHYGLAHGIGRSGDVSAVQPKAAGSSIIVQLCNYMAAHALKIAGMPKMKALVLPLATGMSITLALLAMQKAKPGAKYVIWPRIDQKTCLKAITTSGCIPVVIENLLEGDELRTDLATIEAKIEELGRAKVLCVVTTTSCFAPRIPERLVEVARICAERDVQHLVNNAYGVQAASTANLFAEAVRGYKDAEGTQRQGRIDVVVQSTDKNFLVPVGGAIVTSANKELLEAINTSYPGRASMAPIFDLFVTLLSMGVQGYKSLLQQRKDCYKHLKTELGKVAQKHGERLLECKHNPISLAMSLESFMGDKGDRRGVTLLGSMLFSRNVSGSRAVSGGGSKTVAGIEFPGYGAHADAYPTPYLTAAAAMGMTTEDVGVYCKRLDVTLKELRDKLSEKPNKGKEKPVPAPAQAAGIGSSDEEGEAATPAAPQGTASAAMEGPLGDVTIEFEPSGFLTSMEMPLSCSGTEALQMALDHAATFFDDDDDDDEWASLKTEPYEMTIDLQTINMAASLISQGVESGVTITVTCGEP